MHPIPETAQKAGMPLHLKVLIGFALGAILGLLVHAQGLEQAAVVQSAIAWVTSAGSMCAPGCRKLAITRPMRTARPVTTAV